MLVTSKRRMEKDKAREMVGRGDGFFGQVDADASEIVAKSKAEETEIKETSRLERNGMEMCVGV